MPTSTAKVRTLGPGSLLIGETATAQKFDADTTNTVLTPKADAGDSINFLDGSEEAGELNVTYTLDGTIKEDFSTNGIQAFCFDHAGETMPFTFVPNTKGSLGFKGEVQITPLAVGGDVKTKNDQDFSFAATNVTKYDPSATPTESNDSGE